MSGRLRITTPAETSSVNGMRMRWQEVSARRLVRSHLAGPRQELGAAQVSTDLVGVHAQVMSAAELSIGLRTAVGDRDDVRAALWAQRSLVKTRGPRGTVHLIAARDLPMWTGALSAVPAGPSPFKPDVRLSAAQTDEVVAAIDVAVTATEAELTVDELTAAIIERAGPWAGEKVMPAFQDFWPRWRQVESIATDRGVLCFGPARGRRTTYTSPKRWLPGFRPAPPAEALQGLVKSYLHAYGPATPELFARWFGASARWSAQLFAGLTDHLEGVDFDGVPAWQNADDGREVSDPVAGGSVRLVPYFDAYVIGCHPRTTLFPPRAAARALTNGQAGNVPVLLVDGIVAGVWHQRRSGRRIVVTVEIFGRLTAAQRRALEDEVERIGVILDGIAQLIVGNVEIGAHA
jgi:hypothetical protein